MKKVTAIVLTIGFMMPLLTGMFISSASAVESGTTGDCEWSLDGNVLTISGEGRMADYEYSGDNTAPWVRSDDITEIIISDGVEYIGTRAFEGCGNFTSITIPDSVTEIGEYAFSHCEGLTAITIPDGATRIEEGVFQSCESLASVTLPDSMASVGRGAFFGCSKLTSVVIPDKVTEIGVYAFSNCEGLTEITLPDSVVEIDEGAFSETSYYNNKLNWEDGVLYIGKHLIAATADIPDVYTIKEGTLTIAAKAFGECELTSLTVPDGIKYVGSDALFLCDAENVRFFSQEQRLVFVKGTALINANITVECAGEHTFTDSNKCDVCGTKTISDENTDDNDDTDSGNVLTVIIVIACVVSVSVIVIVMISVKRKKPQKNN